MLKKIWHFIRIFNDKEIFIFSSALSFYTILSLIPILFVCFSIFTQIPSFTSYYDRLKNLIFNFLVPTQQELISSYLDTFLKNSVNLGFVGFIAMIITSLAFFSSYDYIVNRITKSEPKSLWQSISSYWTLITLTPLGLGLSFYISSYIQKTLDDFNVGFNFFEILPFVIIWGLFFTSFSSSLSKVALKILCIISFASAMIWYVSKNLFVYYVVYNKAYADVYGSFSAILFFVIWIYLSWVIYLFGLKICHYLSFKTPSETKTSTPRKRKAVSKT